MERYTYKHDDKWCVKGSNRKITSDRYGNYWGEAIDRLAEYEELGFTPTNIIYMAKFFKEQTSAEMIAYKMRNIARILEWEKWKNLEEQGRLIILPEE